MSGFVLSRPAQGHKTDIHAEADALTALLASGRSCQGVSAFVSSVTCQDCFALLANCGIKRVLYPKPDDGYYSSHRAKISRIARHHAIDVLEVPPLRPYRPLPDGFLETLPRLPRAWGQGGDFHAPADGAEECALGPPAGDDAREAQQSCLASSGARSGASRGAADKG